MRTDKNKLAETLRYGIAVIIIAAASFYTCEERGFIASLPVDLICFFAVSLIWDELYKNVILISFFSLLFRTVDFADVKLSVLYTLYLLLIFLLARYAAGQVRQLFKRKKVFIKVLNALAFLVFVFSAVFTHFYFLGTPLGMNETQELAREYAFSKYGEGFTKIMPYYSVKEGKYCARLYFDNEGNTLYSDVVLEDGSVVRDGHFDYVLDKEYNKERAKLLEIIRAKYSERFELDFGGTSIKYNSFEKIDLSTSEAHRTFSYRIVFRAEMPSANMFSEVVTKYAEEIFASSLEYNEIIFYAGDQGRLLYKLTITPESDITNLISKIEKLAIS